MISTLVAGTLYIRALGNTCHLEGAKGPAWGNKKRWPRHHMFWPGLRKNSGTLRAGMIEVGKEN